jgi:hypothetical protein
VGAGCVAPDPLWPVRLKPEPDELLTSWLLRLACAYSTTLSRFVGAILPGSSISYHDLDYGLEPALLNALARGTGIAPSGIRRHEILTPDADSVAPWPRADQAWVLPMPTSRVAVHQPGQPYCAVCLAEDTVPYLRRRWRRVYVTLCDVHQVELLDRCLTCNTPLNLRWAERSPLPARIAAPITLCCHCGGDLRAAAGAARDRPGRPEDREAIDLLSDVAYTGWAILPGHEPIPAPLYFRVVIGLCEGEARYRLQAAVGRAGGPGSAEADRQGTPFQHPRERRGRITSMLWLLQDWPERFVELCWLYELDHTHLCRGMRHPIPSWYWSILVENLHAPIERDPREEDWLRREIRAKPAEQPSERIQGLTRWLYTGNIEDLFAYLERIDDLPPVLRQAGRLRYAGQYWVPRLGWWQWPYFPVASPVT